MLTKNKSLLFLIVILAIASFFRLYKLDSIPPGLYPDVAINGNEALESLRTKNFKVFYPENNGREGLMIWLISLFFLVFGVSIWSIKIVAAIIGILTVFGLYLLTKELLDSLESKVYGLRSEAIALLSSFFLATSFWHTNFSRIGFRAILLPFVLVFSFYFLFRGFRLKKVSNLILAGLVFGFGFYTYTSFRVAVLLLSIILIFWWFTYKKQNLQKQFLLYTSCFLLFTFIIALPLGIYFLKNPEGFISRAAPISIFAAKQSFKEFGKSLILHLGMFNFYGDPNWRHNFAGSPMLFWPLGILFLIGILLSVKDLILSIKNKNFILNTPYLILLSWFFIMLLPGILTYEGIPHALRTIGVIPVVYIFTALGAWFIYDWLNKTVKGGKALFILFCLFFALIFLSEFNKYFFLWGKKPEVKNAFSKDYLEIGNYLNSLPQEVKKYVIINQTGVPVPWPNGLPMPAQTIMFVENTKYGKIQSTYLLPEELDKIKINKETTVIVPMGYDGELFDELKVRFPQGETQNRNGLLIYQI